MKLLKVSKSQHKTSEKQLTEIRLTKLRLERFQKQSNIDGPVYNTRDKI